MTLFAGLTFLLSFLPERATEKQRRIYNGENAVPGEFPFMVQVLADIEFDSAGVVTQNLCGGSILATNLILTAAHCVVRDVSGSGNRFEAQDQIYNPIQLGVWAGDLDDFYNQQFASVKAIIVHPDYDSYRVMNDIALILLEDEVQFNKYTSPISLPADVDIEQLYAEGSPVTVIGWGFTEQGDTSHLLQKLSYEVTSRDTCIESYGDQIRPGMLCTGSKPMERRSAIGDSGGPVFSKVGEKWVQLGIVSWGAEDQDESSFDVNTDVSYYKSWILSSINRISSEFVREYIVSDETEHIVLEDLPNFTYRHFTVRPGETSRYARIRIKDSFLTENSFISVYDGVPRQNNNQMLAQLTGEIQHVDVVGYSGNTLTVVITTGNSVKCDHLDLTLDLVNEASSEHRLICSPGYTACLDNLYCVPDVHFCNGVGICNDASDEITDVCETIKGDTNTSTYSINACVRDSNRESEPPSSRCVRISNSSPLIMSIAVLLGFLVFK
ncbi:hypothetical protein ACHWQZ_G004913 [Mnemiopsis leidyi]